VMGPVARADVLVCDGHQSFAFLVLYRGTHTTETRMGFPQWTQFCIHVELAPLSGVKYPPQFGQRGRLVSSVLRSNRLGSHIVIMPHLRRARFAEHP
jgi:hypothetical protein